MLYNKSGSHLFTKKSSREKSRKLPSHTVSDADLERILKLIGE